MKRCDETKLQIPVPLKVAEEVAYFADRWNKTQSEMAALILEVAIDHRQDIASRIVLRILRPFVGRSRPSKRGKTTKDISEMVRMQVVVSQKVRESIDAMGAEIGLSGVKMAGVLIDCTIEDESWVMELIASYVLRFVQDTAKENLKVSKTKKRKAI
jgi:hypothetical protein